ncbi:MAG: Crp/Fnr family transcriptional regulator [Anaerolineae bacterium]
MADSANRAAVRRLLSAQPLFADLPQDDLTALASITYVQQTPRGRRLWDQGGPGERYFVVVQGEVAISRLDTAGAEQELDRLGPGDGVGEASLLLGDAHDASLTTVEPSKLLVIPRDDFLDLLKARPALRRHLRPREEICAALEAARYPWQEADERLVLTRHHHSWALWRDLLLPVLVFAAALPLVYFRREWWPLLAVVGPLTLAWGLWVWLDWRNDLLVLTTRRLVRLERRLVFYERQQQAPLDKVQDIAVVRAGLAAALFGFGQVTVQTAGASGQLRFPVCPRPDGVKDSIFAQVERFRAYQRSLRRQGMEAELRRQMGLTVEVPVTDGPVQTGFVPQGPVDTAAAYLTKLIQSGFPRLRQQEGDVVIWRKHWLVLLRDLAWPVLVAAAGAAVPIFLDLDVPVPAVLGAAAVLVLWAWWQWENWRNDVYVLTPDRIIDVERIPLRLRSERREGALGNIQNVTYVIPSLFANILNLGDVTIETAGQTGNFTFSSVYDPGGVQADVFRYVEAARERQQRAEDTEQQRVLADLLAAYERLRNELESKSGDR